MAVKAAFVRLPAPVETLLHSTTQNKISPVTVRTKNVGIIYLSK